MTTTHPRIGFIGLGRMGAGMALNLRQAGFETTVHDVSRDAAAEHLSAGCAWAATPAELAAASDVVFTSLPNPQIVKTVALGPAGLMEGMTEGSAWFDLSTTGPRQITELRDAFLPRRVHVLDAPVSGGPSGARSGKLAVWVGGDEAVYQAHRAVLDAISDAHRYIGGIGAASIAKLVHNAAGYAFNIVLSELFSAGMAAGVQPLALWEAIREGGLGRLRTFDLLAPQFLPQKFDPAAYMLALAHKDVALMTEVGHHYGVPMRLVEGALADMTEALNRGWGERDSRSAMLVQLQRSGVDVDAMRCDPEDVARVLGS